MATPRLTVALKPSMLVTVRLDLAEEPAGNTDIEGLAAIAKSGTTLMLAMKVDQHGPVLTPSFSRETVVGQIPVELE